MKKFKIIAVSVLAALIVPLITPVVSQAAVLSNLTINVGKTTATIQTGVQTAQNSTNTLIYVLWTTNNVALLAITNGSDVCVSTPTNVVQSVGGSLTYYIGDLGECSNYSAVAVGLEMGQTTNTYSAVSQWTNNCPVLGGAGSIYGPSAGGGGTNNIPIGLIAGASNEVIVTLSQGSPSTNFYSHVYTVPGK